MTAKNIIPPKRWGLTSGVTDVRKHQSCLTLDAGARVCVRLPPLAARLTTGEL
ncbi:MAG: hypothetical protein H0T63_10210 [Pyrinomonadaceae bacterium]|nr:hypothetical protein [Pyrinomonadaceae bacterium]MDQ3586451.1 hypothetical protein [Acidobacteriota bacterium]